MNSNQSEQAVAGRLPRRVVIVGETESAWMAAALLSLSAGQMIRKITVVTAGDPREEFPGESTLPSFTRLIANPGLGEHEMMRSCDGTWQMATQFSDWVRMDRDFWLPFFGGPDALDQATFFQAWQSERVQGRLLRPLHSYTMQWGAAIAGKAPTGFSKRSVINESQAYAFHVDGQGLANWFRQIALALGVEEIRGEVAVVSPNGRGGVAQLRLADGALIAGDFFIDCSGHPGVVVSRTNGNAWEPLPNHTPCSRMISMQLPAGRQILPYTRITAMESGWAWHRPRYSSISVGCMSSCDTCSNDMAVRELAELLLFDGHISEEQAGSVDLLRESLNPTETLLQPGRRQQFWRDNVVAIGSAATVTDPIVNAGRHLSLLGLELFLDLFPDRNTNADVRDAYNRKVRVAVDELSDLAALHYHLNGRADSAFWQAAKGSALSSTLIERLELFDATVHLDVNTTDLSGVAAWWFLLAGCQRFPRGPAVTATACPSGFLQQALGDIVRMHDEQLKDLPMHEEMLDWIHAGTSSLQRSA
ncbi:MAG: tryptophan 7-halogenase [Planctomycetaceae bacterium]|nr:tryptophan 7-halogenase [Planctomycetaceae bacterium]